MKCQHAMQHLSAFMDNELADDQVAEELQLHLDGCDGCRNELEQLELLDTQLRTTLLPQSVRQAGLDRIHKARQVSRAPSEAPSATRWAMATAAIAATILLIFSADENQHQQPDPPVVPVAPVTPIAHLVRSTGDVDIWPPGESRWVQVNPERHVPVSKGSRIRTPENVLCELKTESNCLIRLDQRAELVLHQPKRCEVIHGQIWCETSELDSLTVEIPSNDNVGKLVLVCPSKTSTQWTVDPKESYCFNGDAQPVPLQFGQFQCDVLPGTTVTVNAEGPPQTVENPKAANRAWQLPLLAVTSGGSSQTITDELIATLRPLLAPIGHTKARHMNEKQITQLGPAGAIPLLAYVQSEDSKNNGNERYVAMSIACRIADETSGKLLLGLINDEDPQIQKLARSTLSRVGEPTEANASAMDQ